MEAATKNRRGRPNIYKAHQVEIAEAINRNSFPSYSNRSLTNLLYVQAGMEIAQQLYGEEGTKQLFSTDRGNMKHKSILEQIGRMFLQNQFSEESCKNALSEAVELLQQGAKVKDIERAIRITRTVPQQEGS